MRGIGLVLAVFIVTTTAGNADVLLLDSIHTAPPNDSSGIPRPHRGSSMDAVRSRFGQATEEVPAIGEPPITRWTYPQYPVYFEYQHVIDVVVHR